MSSLLPTVHIAPAIGWPTGVAPAAAPGLQVQAFERGLEHPRWLAVLPNGDVLVAESNAPAKPAQDQDQGLRAWVKGLVMGLPTLIPELSRRARPPPSLTGPVGRFEPALQASSQISWAMWQDRPCSARLQAWFASVWAYCL